MQAEGKEILSAEVFLDSLGHKANTADIDAALDRVNRELQAYRCEAGFEDYAIAVLCGVLSGAVDALLLKQVEITPEGITTAPEQVFKCLQDAADQGKKAVTAPAFRHVKVKKGFADALPELETLSKNATSAGIVCSILSQFSSSGMLRYDGDKVRLFPEGLSRSNGICVAGAGLVAGLMKWLYDATAPEAEAAVPKTARARVNTNVSSRSRISCFFISIDTSHRIKLIAVSSHQLLTGHELAPEIGGHHGFAAAPVLIIDLAVLHPGPAGTLDGGQ
jgi:hypothetical protein